MTGTIGAGNDRIGNFAAVNLMRSERFLDTPEAQPLHVLVNNLYLFDRFAFRPSPSDSLHLNVFYARSWFQIPNTLDQQAGGQDQRQLVRSINVAPGWVHIVNSSTVLTVNPYFRRDRVNYDPSASPLADQPATVRQFRELTNVGVKADVAYAKGPHNLKAGLQLGRTMLEEDFTLGLTDATFNPVCLTPDGQPVTDPALTTAAGCAAAGYEPNPGFAPGLIPYDLTRSGSLFRFRDRAAIN